MKETRCRFKWNDVACYSIPDYIKFKAITEINVFSFSLDV